MTFRSVRRFFTHAQKIFAPQDKIFPLFCPVKGYEWIEDWNAELIFSKSGFAETGCIFKTFDDDYGEDLWIVSEYRPPSFIKFIRKNRYRTMIYQITISPGPDNSTNLLWEQEITSINDKGSEHVADLEKQDFMDMVDMLEELMIEHLDTCQVKLRKAGHDKPAL